MQNILTISNTKSVRSFVHYLFGRRLDMPRKGINIIGGKKVVVK